MRRSCAGRHRRAAVSQELVYRSARPPARPISQPAPQIIHNTVHQTIVHLHQATYRRVSGRFTAAGGKAAELVVRQVPPPLAPEDGVDPSRPALMASKLLRVLSTESAQKVLQPFFYRIIQRFLEQERENRRCGPVPYPPAAGAGLSGAEFQALVQSVTDAMDRRARMNLLRRGGSA